MASYASALIKTAIAEIGYKEKRTNAQLDDKTANAGGGNWTKYARDFDSKWPNWYNGPKNGFDWCDMFYDWCMVTTFGYKEALRLTCQPEKSAGAGCGYSLGYYKAKGQFYTSSPKPGDQIFFGSSTSDVDHTGLVEKVEGSTVHTIEGNTSEMVARRTYALSNGYIVGYGRPAFDPEPAGSGSSTSAPAPAPSTGVSGIKVGDVVNFTGTKHYASSTATSAASCKPGKAKVTGIAAGAKHPYHLIHTGDDSTVYGWGDAADIGGGKTGEELAREVIAGKWGAGDERKQRLTAAGYDYAAVQAQVNKMI